MDSSPRKTTTLIRTICPLLVLLLLVVNGIGLIFGWRLMADFDENRDLAKAPQWSGSLPQYLRAFDAFVKDNFPLRKPFLLGYNSSLYYGFRSSSHPRVVIGRNGWIFDSGDTKTELRHLPARYLRRLRIGLEERRDWLAEQGAVFLFMFYPTKTTAYGERYLPSHARLDSDYVSPTGQAAQSLGPGLAANFVAIEQPLREAATRSDGYYFLTDGHATHEGAFLAVEKLCEQLRSSHSLVPLTSFPAHEFKLDLLYPTSAGRLMGVPLREMSQVRVPNGGFNTKPTALPAAIARAAADQPETQYFANPKVTESRLVLLGDSFTDRMNFYLGESFSEVISINLNNSPATPDGKFPIALLKAFKPNVVVTAYLEARLLESASGIEKDLVPLLNPPEVRQSRLRRLFDGARESTQPVHFTPFVCDNKTIACIVVPNGGIPDQDELLLQLEYRGEKPITLYWDNPTDSLPGEQKEIVLGPDRRKAFIFLPRIKAGALDVLRTDQTEFDESHLSGEGVWVNSTDL
ncbi:MAG: alginate O-acetyltransferase AlgX-related protein [Terrimicrobiaceae bacterium]